MASVQPRSLSQRLSSRHRPRHRAAAARPRWLARVAAAAAGCGALFATLNARAAGPLGPNGAPIETSDFGLDVFTGPVLGGSRMTGLAGAYSAIAEGTDGNLVNAASPAVRPFYSLDYFDYWLGFGLTLPALSEMDYFNTGERDPSQNLPSSFLYLTPALNLQFGTFGVGLTFEFQRYAVDASTSSGQLATIITTSHLQFANGFFGGQLVAGIGSRAVSLSASDQSCEDELSLVGCSVAERPKEGSSFTSIGVGPEIGVLVKPFNLPFRAGISFRSAIQTDPQYTDEFLPNENGDLTMPGMEGQPFYLPRRVELPWDLNLGFAFQFGRPFNPVWRTPQDLAEKELLTLRLAEIEIEGRRDRELAVAVEPAERAAIKARYDLELKRHAVHVDAAMTRARAEQQRELAYWDRFYVLVTSSLTIAGAVESSVGVESYVNQSVVRSGTKTTYSPHFAIESEAIPDWLKLRSGFYYEPGRSSGSTSRGHATFGGDIRMGNFDVFGLWPADYIWGLGGFADVAPRYATFGVSLIGWYPRHRKAEYQ